MFLTFLHEANYMPCQISFDTFRKRFLGNQFIQKIRFELRIISVASDKTFFGLSQDLRQIDGGNTCQLVSTARITFNVATRVFQSCGSERRHAVKPMPFGILNSVVDVLDRPTSRKEEAIHSLQAIAKLTSKNVIRLLFRKKNRDRDCRNRSHCLHPAGGLA